LVLAYLELIIALSILVVLLVVTGEARAVEPIAPYSSSSDNPSTTDTRTDKYLLAHLGNFRPVTIANGDGTEGGNIEAWLKSRVLESEIPSHTASSSIASFYEDYFGSTPPSNNDITSIGPMAGNNPFSTPMLFETLSVLTTLTTFPHNHLIDVDLSGILGFGNSRISVGLRGQLPSVLQIPTVGLQDNSLIPISYFSTFTIRF
jgi:hypothetical protein